MRTLPARAALVWLLIVAVETVHGIARRLWLEPRIGDLPARQVGVAVGALLIVVVAAACARWLAVRTRGRALAVGIGWALAMVAFEVALGLATGATLARLTADYDPRRGGFMVLGMLVLVFAPVWAARWRGTLRQAPRGA